MRLFKTEIKKIPSNLLTDRFLVPPFTILDTKQGYWQERKRNWIKLGIQSELGRDNHLTRNLGCFNYEDEKERTAFERNSSGEEKFGIKSEMTSIFDPVICELAYKWFSLSEAKVLDPFAGGSVRGIVASALKREYVGIDLSKAQVEANKKQYEDISDKYSGMTPPIWINDNSANVKKIVGKKRFDFVFSCPPYYNLEVYSDKPEDLSCKGTYDEFITEYGKIISECCDLLKDDSFAVFVVANIRDKNGAYYNFVGDTITAFQKSGLIFYNDVILVNVAGTLPVRAPIQFNATRKLGKQHQNILVFYKGNPKNIKEKFGSFEELIKEEE